MKSAPANRDRPLIVIADDEALLRLLMRRALEPLDCQILEAANGRECLALCQQHHPDVLLLDVLMPQMDGFEVCTELRQQLGDNRPAVLMITLLDDRDSVDRAFSLGTSDFITKPIHWALLQQRVRWMLQVRQAMGVLSQQREQQEQRVRELQRAHQTLQTENQTLTRQVLMDDLTQLANRRAFNRYLWKVWQQLAEEAAPLSLILADLDDFKAFNNQYGHIAGDQCLQTIAALWKRRIQRSTDLLARYGGEAFAVLLPQTDLPGAVQVAERLKMASHHLRVPEVMAASPLPITLSFGVSSGIPQLDQSPDQLIQQADRALRQAKEAGLNQLRALTLTPVGHPVLGD